MYKYQYMTIHMFTVICVAMMMFMHIYFITFFPLCLLFNIDLFILNQPDKLIEQLYNYIYNYTYSSFAVTYKGA